MQLTVFKFAPTFFRVPQIKALVAALGGDAVRAATASRYPMAPFATSEMGACKTVVELVTSSSPHPDAQLPAP